MSNSELRNRIFQGHIIEALQRFPDQSVHTIVTSPPYYGLRNYDIPKSVWGGRTDCDHDWTDEAQRLYVSTTSNTGGKYCRKCGAWLGCLGEEPEIEMYIEHLHSVCKELHRVLRDDGTFWLNMGDSYWGSGNAAGHNDDTENLGRKTVRCGSTRGHSQRKHVVLKPKSQILIPHRLALSLEGFTVIPADELWNMADSLEYARRENDWDSVKLIEGILRRWSFASKMVNSTGWIIRSTVIWHKNNPTPESSIDRPTNDFEYVFLMTKSSKKVFFTHPAKRGARKKPVADYIWSHRKNGAVLNYPPLKNPILLKKLWKRRNLWRAHDYYFDMEAIKEPMKDSSIRRAFTRNNADRRKDNEKHVYSLNTAAQEKAYIKLREKVKSGKVIKRHKRAIWSIPTFSYRGAHFATFPPALIEPMIKAGTSPYVCAECGAPWTRVIGKTTCFHGGSGKAGRSAEEVNSRGKWAGNQPGANIKLGPVVASETLKWVATCDCDAAKAKAIVFDPFMGAGTTAVVSQKLGRDYSGCEIGGQYIALTNERIKRENLPLPLETEI